MLRHVLIAMLTIAASATPAGAQTAIEVPGNARWLHAQTQLTLAPALAGLARTGIRDAGAGELDVSVQYGDEITAATVYIYRPALLSAPLWFDRAERAILLREAFGQSVPHGPALPFAAPNASTASALRRTFATGKGPYKSTAVAIIPVGEWLVKLRVSSQRDDPAALDARLGTIIAQIGWPKAVPASPAAVLIDTCSGPLAYAGNAKMVRPSMEDAMLGGLINAAATLPDAKQEQKPVTWCRESAGDARFGVYRADAEADGYTIAIGDAGRVVSLRPAFTLEKGKKPGIQMSIGDLHRVMIYPSFDKLPQPTAALQALAKSQPISSVARDSKQVNINLDKEMMK